MERLSMLMSLFLIIPPVCIVGCDGQQSPKQDLKAEILQSKTEPPKTIGRTEYGKWYEGGTLHKSNMKDWSRATYDNKLATAADLVLGCLEIDGVDITKIDIEKELKPMATDFAKGLDNANADGLADNLDVAEVAATIWLLMKNGN